MDLKKLSLSELQEEFIFFHRGIFYQYPQGLTQKEFYSRESLEAEIRGLNRILDRDQQV